MPTATQGISKRHKVIQRWPEDCLSIAQDVQHQGSATLVLTQNASAPEQIPAATLATDIDDPVQRALAKRAKQEQAGAANPAAVLQRAVESAEARLEKARLKLTNAETVQDSNVDAFKLAVDKCQSKLNQARAALDAHDAT